MLRVTVTLNELSSKIARVEGGEGDPVNLGLSETRTFDIPEGKSLTIGESDVSADMTARNTSGEPLTDIGPGLHNNPNGITRAEISAKFPKAGGETIQVAEGGRIVERMQAPDDAQARQAGGVDSKDGTTPGPKPGEGLRQPSGVDATAEDRGAARAAATGAPPPPARPDEAAVRTATKRAATKTATKSSSKKSSRK